MLGSAAVAQPVWQQSPTITGALAVMTADRDNLTQLLRGLAARLDELDRRLADLAWHRRRPHIGTGIGETFCERSALEAEQERLAVRLSALASRLLVLNNKLSDIAGDSLDRSASVGTCPYCGYPSLGSGLCAFCRPYLAR